MAIGVWNPSPGKCPAFSLLITWLAQVKGSDGALWLKRATGWSLQIWAQSSNQTFRASEAHSSSFKLLLSSLTCRGFLCLKETQVYSSFSQLALDFGIFPIPCLELGNLLDERLEMSQQWALAAQKPTLSWTASKESWGRWFCHFVLFLWGITWSATSISGAPP